MYRFCFSELTFRQFVELFYGDSWTLSKIKRFSSQIVKRAIRHNRLLPMRDRKRGDFEIEL
jgi:hypothetical protein